MLSLLKLVAAEVLCRSREALLTQHDRMRLQEFEMMREDRDSFEAQLAVAERKLAAAKAEGKQLMKAVTQLDSWLSVQANFFVRNPQVHRTFLDVAAKLLALLKAAAEASSGT